MLHVLSQTEAWEANFKSKNEQACDLLLARLFQFHPEEAAAALKGIQPRVVDSDEPFIKHIQLVAPLPGEQSVPIKTLSGKPKIGLIAKVTGEHFNVSYSDMMSARRTKHLVIPRHVAMFLAKELTLKSLPEIGREMGDRDHTTVLHGVRKITRKLTTDVKLGWDIDAIKARLSEILNA